MSVKKTGAYALKAASSNIRLNILRHLFSRGVLSYTEIMSLLKMSPSKDAGRFAYHLKALLNADLIEPDPKTKKYKLTDLGRLVLDVVDEVEKRAIGRRKMLVRTSKLSIEEFDRSKIAESLMREAGVPEELAQRIAKDAESRLQEFKTKYLTAPLIREIVNAILIERGLEEYRHKLTRLGMPVYDVTQLIQRLGDRKLSAEVVRRAAGEAVLEEYALLNVLPRDIADAHISGYLHLNNLGTWMLKVNEAFHDLRHFLKGGLNLGMGVSWPPPKGFNSALAMILNLLEGAMAEVAGEQIVDYFNLFLAPFVEGMAAEDVKKALKSFLYGLNGFFASSGSPMPISLGLELNVPDFLLSLKAIGPSGEAVGTYADYVDEAQSLVTLILEGLIEEGRRNLFLTPSILIKLRDGTIEDEDQKRILLKAHELAVNVGLSYFANLRWEGQKMASYSATGCRLDDAWKGDWELDTLRTGNVDLVFVNVVRLAYEADGSEPSFFKLLDERLEMAIRSLEIKRRALDKRAHEGLLPLLTSRADGDPYFRLENASGNVSFIGLNEAVQSLSGKMTHEDASSLRLAEEVVRTALEHAKRFWKKGIRTAPAMASGVNVASRLAELDVEKYGQEKVKASSEWGRLTYTSAMAVPSDVDIPLEERLRVEEKFHTTCSGGHALVVHLKDPLSPEELLSLTMRIVSGFYIGLFTYGLRLSYCSSCKNVLPGILPKCPRCGSVSLMYSSGTPIKRSLVSLSAS